MNVYAMKKPKRINAVSISFFLAFALVAYVFYALFVIYWPIFQLHGVMAGACNSAYRTFDDEEVMKKLLQGSKRTGLRLTKDNFRFTRIPYTDEELRNATGANMDDRGKECLIEMRYKDTFELPIIGYRFEWTFEHETRKALDTVKWEKACTCTSLPPDPPGWPFR